MSLSFNIVTVDDDNWYELASPLVITETGVEGYYFKNEVIELDETGKLALFPPFRWDGRSGPAVDTANTLRSSCVHDALYELIILGVLPKNKRRAADVLMFNLDKEDGVGAFRRWYSHVGLRLCGRGKDKRDYISR